MLRPDIAVLEGGYAIEGALPYVNAGIILAMAGMDYSHLKEPDYDPARIRQSEEVTRWVEKVSQKVMGVWQDRKQMGKNIRAGHRQIRRDRNIYYDTDNIYEQQYETIRVCEHCGGALSIDSSARGRNHIFAVHIPRNACDECHKEGTKWYDKADLNRFDKAFLQDRRADIITEKTKKT
jgi:hypothetical protein